MGAAANAIIVIVNFYTQTSQNEWRSATAGEQQKYNREKRQP
jgi:hypothetical protein